MPFVVVMEAADLRNGNDPAGISSLHRPGPRGSRVISNGRPIPVRVLDERLDLGGLIELAAAVGVEPVVREKVVRTF